jgi:hypothetical protein
VKCSTLIATVFLRSVGWAIYVIKNYCSFGVEEADFLIFSPGTTLSSAKPISEFNPDAKPDRHLSSGVC